MEEKKQKRTYRQPTVETVAITCEDVLNSSFEEKDDNQSPWDPQLTLDFWENW